MNAIKPKSQLDKRLDGFTGGGASYLAGEGLSLNQNVFELNQATQATLGGIRVSAYATAPEDSPQSEFDSGIYKADPYQAFLGLRRATKKQMGGLYLGDGLAPTVEQDGETYTNTGHVEVRIGEGLEYAENSETPADEREKRQNNLGGRAITVPKATKEKFGSVKLGKRMSIDADGSVYSVMSGKDGIEVSDNGEISVLIDNETIRIDGDGKLRAEGSGDGVIIENAVVIQEADAKYLLHNYTEVEYVAGNRIGYAGADNQIIIGGYTAVKSGNQLSAPLYQSAVLYSFSGSTLTEHNITVELLSASSNGSYQYTVSDNGTIRGTYTTYDPSTIGFAITWSTIYNSATETAPYGYAYLEFYAITKPTATATANSSTYIGTTSRLNYTFASEAEYNAAVGLTYEPNVLTEVQETVTEV